MSPPADQKIGRYEAQAVIGTGNFATVHRAYDERLGDTVALKVLAENHSLDLDVRERFIAEGRFLRRVDSPHLVRVFDMGETDQDQPFLVLEHADRGSLSARVTSLRSGPGTWRPGPDDLRTVALSLAAAIDALHEADLVHRDLSPGNILLRSRGAGAHSGPQVHGWVVAPDERLLLADLGLCKDLAAHSGLTAGSGTDGFRPPEQRGQPAQVDARADLWALSALLVWLATGRAPGSQPGEVTGAAVADHVTHEGLPRRLGEVLARSLADDPAERHPDVAAWLREVQDALGPPVRPSPALQALSPDELPPTPFSAPASPVPSIGRPAAPQRKRHLALGAVSLVAGLGLGALMALLLDGESDGSPSTEVTQLDDGRLRVSATDGEAELAIEGPAEVAVGDAAAFEMDGQDVDDWVWIMPDGTLIPGGATEVSLEATTPGPAPVTLIGTSGSRDPLEVVHDLRAVE